MKRKDCRASWALFEIVMNNAGVITLLANPAGYYYLFIESSIMDLLP